VVEFAPFPLEDESFEAGGVVVELSVLDGVSELGVDESCFAQPTTAMVATHNNRTLRFMRSPRKCVNNQDVPNSPAGQLGAAIQHNAWSQIQFPQSG
jgi:hypothetical protein